jgi:hypothetical protein
MNYLKSLGLLRGGLIALGLIDVLIRPEPGSYISYSGFEMVQTLVAPAAAPLFIMVILFDALMSKIRASDSTGEERKRFRIILWTELAAVAFMIIMWLPFYLAIGR